MCDVCFAQFPSKSKVRYAHLCALQLAANYLCRHGDARDVRCTRCAFRFLSVVTNGRACACFLCAQLFKHLDETGHAVPLVQQPASGKVSKKELRRQRAATAKKEGRGFGGAVRG